MSKTKVFVDLAQIEGGYAVVTGDDVRHLRLVLRKQIGDPLLVAAGGDTYLGIIRRIEETQIGVEIGEMHEHKAESPVCISLYQGVAKGDKMDFIVQKAAELGVNEIIPFISSRTVVKLGAEAGERKQRRWQRIAAEAAKQCRRSIIPEVKQPLTFFELTERLPQPGPDSLIILPYEEADQVSLKQVAAQLSHPPGHISAIIGPEGGFSLDEAAVIEKQGGKIIHLGHRILRTETAALVTITLIQYLWGDLS